jgi:hypothetical protein
MKKKIIILAIISAVIVFLIVLFTVKKDWRNEFFSRWKITAIQNEKTDIKPEEKSSENNPEINDNAIDVEAQSVEDTSDQTMCGRECEGIASAADLKYCREVCGLEEIKAPAGDCLDLAGIEKDYCLKDSAVTKKDISLCAPVTDAAVKQTCQNRITEEIIDNAAPIDQL